MEQLKTALGQLDETIAALKDCNEKLVYLNDVTINEENGKMKEIPCMIIYDYLSKIDSHIEKLSEIDGEITAYMKAAEG